jgi:hypothetical protein
MIGSGLESDRIEVARRDEGVFRVVAVELRVAVMGGLRRKPPGKRGTRYTNLEDEGANSVRELAPFSFSTEMR